MNKTTLACIGTLVAAMAQAQQPIPTDWTKIKPMTSVSVAATDKAGVYKFTAVITDLVTDQVVAKPSITTAVGKVATVEFGAKPSMLFRFMVTVDDKGQTAAYRSELVKEGKVESGQSGTLVVVTGS